MKNKLKFGLGQAREYAPHWIINATSIVALIIAAKHYLIYSFPVASNVTKANIDAWVEYGLDIIQVLLALAVIFTGDNKRRVDDTAGN